MSPLEGRAADGSAQLESEEHLRNRKYLCVFTQSSPCRGASVSNLSGCGLYYGLKGPVMLL